MWSRRPGSKAIELRPPACQSDDVNHRELMDRAIELSEEAVERGYGGPFGAVVARDGEIVGEGSNRVPANNDPTAHAEIVAIRDAGVRLDRFDLGGCVLYTSCEPCPMCLAASYWARLDHIYFANSRTDAAAIGFDDAFFYEEIAGSISDRSLPTTRMPHERAAVAFRDWFESEDKVPY
jgi:guanine deaminase